MRNTLRQATALALSVMMLGACSEVSTEGSRESLPIHQLTNIDGDAIDLTELRGRPILLNFWSTTCPSCLQEIPKLIELHRELAGRGLTLIGITMPHDRPDRIVELRAQMDIPYALVFDPIGRLNQEFETRQVTPTHLLVSPDGEIVLRRQGRLDFTDLKSTILTMLQG